MPGICVKAAGFPRGTRNFRPGDTYPLFGKGVHRTMSTRARHTTLPLGLPVLRFSELDSTNKYARKLAESGQLRGRPAVVVAERQTDGVGRFRRQWSSPPGGLWCTYAFPLPQSPAGERVLEGLGLRIGLACTTAISELLQNTKRPCDVRLKWPNDVMVNGRKVAGMLCELVSERESLAQHRYILIGVGVNANFTSVQLPPELREKATGLLDHLACPVKLDSLLASIVGGLQELAPVEGLPHDLLQRVRTLLYGVGQHAAVSMPHGQKVSGVLLGIDSRGLAQLRTDDGVFTAPSGTVLMTDEVLSTSALAHGGIADGHAK